MLHALQTMRLSEYALMIVRHGMAKVAIGNGWCWYCCFCAALTLSDRYDKFIRRWFAWFKTFHDSQRNNSCFCIRERAIAPFIFEAVCFCSWLAAVFFSGDCGQPNGSHSVQVISAADKLYRWCRALAGEHNCSWRTSYVQRRLITRVGSFFWTLSGKQAHFRSLVFVEWRP